MYGHPNYASWAGFSMSSRYEALDPSGRYACSDAAAELRFSVATCPSQKTLRYGCDFFPTQLSIRNCSSKFALYMQEHSWAINPNGTRAGEYASTQNMIELLVCSRIFRLEGLGCRIIDRLHQQRCANPFSGDHLHQLKND
mmetsp:Transcript_41681/g.90335  ORF Transcript_41681/g.90335 Transcript_41681/m.90335 type:complete len:141 (-) Transcript_41681:205-627(-)